MIRRLPAAAALLVIAGCAGEQARYPSLARRAVEGRGFAEPTVPAPAVVADPALDIRIAALGTQMDGIARGFATAVEQAERRGEAARGKPAGSDAWLDAQTALAGLDDWRAQTSALATDVEQLAIARAGTLAPPYPALVALGDRTDAEATRQDATIARLQAMLAPA